MICGFFSTDRIPKPGALLEQAFDQTDGQISPDGRWIAYMSNESGSNEVFVRALTEQRAGHPCSVRVSSSRAVEDERHAGVETAENCCTRRSTGAIMSAPIDWRIGRLANRACASARSAVGLGCLSRWSAAARRRSDPAHRFAALHRHPQLADLAAIAALWRGRVSEPVIVRGVLSRARCRYRSTRGSRLPVSRHSWSTAS